MTSTTITPARSEGMTKDERFVIFASSLGTVFEWYDFYLYGSLAAIIGAQFFSAYPESTRNIFALLAFAAGFLVRPFGAIVFGRVGDIVGRKYTFLVTILIMGLSTFIVGLLPNASLHRHRGSDHPDRAAPAARPCAGRRIRRCRDLRRRTLAARQARLLHLVHSDHRDARPVPLAAGDPVHPHLHRLEAAFAEWGWRIPFLVSVLLLGISVWIRLRLNESPVFQKMKDEGKSSKAPLTEAFANWTNGKIVLLALVGLRPWARR